MSVQPRRGIASRPARPGRGRWGSYFSAGRKREVVHASVSLYVRLNASKARRSSSMVAKLALASQILASGQCGMKSSRDAVARGTKTIGELVVGRRTASSC